MAKIDQTTLKLMQDAGINFEIYYEQPGVPPCPDYLRTEEVEAYLANPIDFISKRLGLSTEQYVTWVECNGFARCGHIRKNGQRCKSAVYGWRWPLAFSEWEEADGGYCKLHGGEPADRHEVKTTRKKSTTP